MTGAVTQLFVVGVIAITFGMGSHRSLRADQLAWGGLRADWSDLSTWSSPDEATREIEHGLGLVLQASAGSIKVAFLGRMSTRDPDRAPASIKVQVGTGTFGNPNDVRTPVLTFAGDPGTDKAVAVDLTPRLTTDGAVGATIRNGMATMPSGDLVSLSRATRVVGTVLGYEVELREDQIRAIRTFLTRLKI